MKAKEKQRMGKVSRLTIKAQIGAERGWDCVACEGKAHAGTDMHETFLSKGDVMCMNPDDRSIIDHEYNCALVCNRVNVNMTATHQLAIRRSVCAWFGMQIADSKFGAADAAVLTEDELVAIGADKVQAWLDNLKRDYPRLIIPQVRSQVL